MKRLLKYFKKLWNPEKEQPTDIFENSGSNPDHILEDLIIQGSAPGIAITVLKKGKVLLEKGYGLADMETRTPVNPKKTLFRIASASKPIAATALAKMTASGLIDLDRSLYDYVPYFPKKEQDFTIRQLAGHTAGIRGYKGKEYALNKPITIKESLDIFKSDPLLFPPGTDFHYNSFDWVLVSLAMQEASGCSFEDYVSKEVLLPLDMTQTFSEDPAKHLPNKAISYTKRKAGFKKAMPVDNRFKLAGGGYLSTSADLAKLGQAYLDQRIVSGEVLEQFLTSQFLDGNPTYYGLGWQVSMDHEGRPYYGHVGNGIGGYSNFYVYPEQEVVISLLMNASNPRIQSVLEEKLYPLFLEGSSLI
ncbi:MAG: beta-lactamase family protein [Eudoraea sp.]|nr:beta-lactamase family protein [Eudoraea sp.]